MTEAAENVHTASITYAVRDTTYEGREIHQGDIMGMIDNKLSVLGNEVHQVGLDIAEKMVGEDTDLITIYYGSDVAEEDAIRELGEGWVGDEAIAIAIFSVMRHIDNFEDCIVCAVNHDGDSDSTGAIAGNIIGAILGYSAIPNHYKEHLEIEPILVSAADDLCADVKEVNQRIGKRYIDHTPASVDTKYLA